MKKRIFLISTCIGIGICQLNAQLSVTVQNSNQNLLGGTLNMNISTSDLDSENFYPVTYEVHNQSSEDISLKLIQVKENGINIDYEAIETDFHYMVDTTVYCLLENSFDPRLNPLSANSSTTITIYYHALNPNIPASGTFKYYLGTSCTDFIDSFQVELDYTVGLPEIDESFFSIYPNPSSEKVYLKTKNTMKINKIEITDLTGKVVTVPTLQADQSIDVSMLKKGLYHIVIESVGRRYFEKIVIRE